MPIYLPWFSIATAILSVIATIFSTNKCVWILPIYVAFFIALLILSCLDIVKLPRPVPILLFIPILVFLYTGYFAVTPGAHDLSGYANKSVVFRGVFLEAPKRCQSTSAIDYTAIIGALSLVFPEQKPLDGKTRLIIISSDRDLSPQFNPGQIVKIEGQIKGISHKQEPWLSGLETTAKHNGVFSQVRAHLSNIRVIDTTNDHIPSSGCLGSTNTLIDYLRQRIANLHLHYLGAKAGSLLASMVLGDRAVTLDASLLNAFRKVGLSHIVAASGFNLTIITFITYWILRKLFGRRPFITLVVCANVIFYAILAGLSASIVRSVIACLLLLLVHLYHRKFHSLAALAIVLLINLIVDPGIVMDLGAQLSYAAVAGILLGGDSLTKTISMGSNNKITNLFASSISIILLAQMAVLPIQLYHFWQTSFLFLPANLIVDPLVAPITIFGFIASFAGLLDLGPIHIGSCLCQFLDLLASIPLQIIIFITEKLSSSNLAVINTGQPSLTAIALYYTALLLFLATLGKGKYRTLSLTLFSTALIFLFYKPDLKQPVLVFLPNSTIAINIKRRAICLGDESAKTSKILSYYGAQLVSIKYDQDKTFRFSLFVKPSSFITLNEATQPSRFLLNHPSEENTGSQTYTVIMGKYRDHLSKLEPSLSPTSSLSLAKLSKELPDIDIKLCCPQNSVSIRVSNSSAKAFSNFY